MPKHVATWMDNLEASQFNNWRESLALQAVYNENHWRKLDDMSCPNGAGSSFVSTKWRFYQMGKHSAYPVHAFCAGCGVVFNRMQPLVANQ